MYNLLISRLIVSISQFSIFPFLTSYIYKTFNIDIKYSIVITGSILVLSRIFAFPMGAISDRYNPKIILLISTLISSTSLFIIFMLNSVLDNNKYLFIISFLLYSIGSSGYLIGFRSYIPYIIEKDEITRVFSFLSISYNLGSIIGISIGAFFYLRGLEVLLYAICCILFIVSYFILKQKPIINHDKYSPRKKDIQKKLNYKYSILFFCVYINIIILMNFLMLLLTKYVEDINISVKYVIYFFSSQSLIVCILLFLVGKLIKDQKPQILLNIYCISALLVGLSTILFGFVNIENVSLIFVISGVLVAISQSMGVPISNTLLTLLKISNNNQGKVFGIQAYIESIAIVSAILVSTFLYPFFLSHNSSNLFWISCGMISLIIVSINMFMINRIKG